VPRTRPPYPEEFRREAIRLARLGDKPQRKLAKDLGISDVTLRTGSRTRRPRAVSAQAASRTTSATSFSGSEMRTRPCEWSGRSCEKQRSSSRGRTTGGRRGVLVDRCGEEQLSRRRDVPRAARQPDWFSQLGAQGAVRSGAHGRVADREDQAHPRGQPGRVRGAQDPRRTAHGARRPCRPQADRAADESRRYRGRQAPQALQDDDPDSGDLARHRPGRAPVPTRSAQRAVGR
jgi:transposase-like protein